MAWGDTIPARRWRLPRLAPIPDLSRSLQMGTDLSARFPAQPPSCAVDVRHRDTLVLLSHKLKYLGLLVIGTLCTHTHTQLDSVY